jgi:hypothetical protein
MRLGKELAAKVLELAGVPAEPKAPKYGNRKVVRQIDGQEVRFDSVAEARRYDELVLLYLAGRIDKPLIHKAYDLCVNGVRVCTYVSDFSYLDLVTGRWVVEDVKGKRTRAYRLKAKLFLALYGFPITEIQAWPKRKRGSKRGTR